MPGILIDYTRFVEVQQRRARIGAELGQQHETNASRTRVSLSDESIHAGEASAGGGDAEMTRGAVDVR